MIETSTLYGFSLAHTGSSLVIISDPSEIQEQQICILYLRSALDHLFSVDFSRSSLAIYFFMCSAGI